MNNNANQNGGTLQRERQSALSRLPGLSVKIITILSGSVTAISVIYASLISPKTDFFHLISLAGFIVSMVTAGLAVYILVHKTRTPSIVSEEYVIKPAFSSEEHTAARKKLLPIAAVILLISVAAFFTTRYLTPVIMEISILETDSEVVVIKGDRFGTKTEIVRVLFDNKEQVPISVLDTRIQTSVPTGFHKGGISVRRGTRSSPAVYFSYPGVVYDAAVAELIQPTESAIGGMLNLLETFPGFPYYSRHSDHPSQWPPRVWKERTAFQKQIEKRLSDQAVKVELDQWLSSNTPSVSMPGYSSEEPIFRYVNLRFLLAENKGNYAGISTLIGQHTTGAMRALEDQRKRLTKTLPNRMLILRVQNRQNEDVKNFTAEFKVGGAVYDVTLNAEGEQARSLEWSPNRQTIDISTLRPGYTADIQVWYYRLPLSKRIFPDAMDVEWEKTEGIVVQNISISGGYVRRLPRLLEEFQAYHRYHVDPVRGSPTFGRLPETSALSDTNALEQIQTNDGVSTVEQLLPEGKPPYALLIASNLFGRYPDRNDAFEAQVRQAKAFTDFSSALVDAATDADGYWIYERFTPVKAAYNRFSGAYLMDGGQLAILYTKKIFDVTALPGWREIDRAANANFQFIPWKDVQYEVVLHYFSDPTDSKGDSKRLLTKHLSLDQVFDLEEAKKGSRNVISPLFTDILRFSRERLKRRYQANFTLDDTTDPTDPFYLVVRHRNVNENFYLPKEWMPIAESPAERVRKDAELNIYFSRLYDYAESSRQLTQSEFDGIFGVR
jgi:hypothetical protein